MKPVLIAFAFLGCASLASAQTVTTPSNKFGWDIVAPDAATAQAYTYKVYSDGATTGVVLAPVTCALAGTTITCTVPIPAYTPGAHTVAITASNAAGESPKSGPFTFTMTLIPNAPTGLRSQ